MIQSFFYCLKDRDRDRDRDRVIWIKIVSSAMYCVVLNDE